MTILKKGYTTGVHTSFAFKTALESFLVTNNLTQSITQKMPNDDLDVTKGCKILVSISDNKNDLYLNKIKHKPYILKNNNTILKLYAGNGVGVVTKDGLKPPKNYPAINPKPLEVLENIFKKFNFKNLTLFCTISVINGENIAKQTANAKVGVLGGISILGTTGWVKPVSSTAYINSIKEELNFAKANCYTQVIFTLGNTAYKEAITSYNLSDTYIIEIGNFIYDGIKLAVEKEFDNIVLILGIAKAVKIAQGFKNTHNRFGSIDFTQIQKLVNIDITQVATIKRVCELLNDDLCSFEKTIQQKVSKQIKSWFSTQVAVVLI